METLKALRMAFASPVVVQVRPHLPSTSGDLFDRSRTRYRPRMDGEREIYSVASHPRPLFPAVKLVPKETRQAALQACRAPQPSFTLAFKAFAAERTSRALQAAQKRGRFITSTYPRAAFPKPRAIHRGRRRSQLVLRSYRWRRQQRASQAALVRRAVAFSAASPPAQAFGPAAAPSPAAKHTAQAAARCAARAVADGCGCSLTPVPRKRAPAGPPSKVPFGTRESSLACVSFGPAPALSQAAKQNARAAARSAARAVAEGRAGALTPTPPPPPRKRAPAGPPPSKSPSSKPRLA
eukprot:jgi/Mesen1/9173/ME000591S08497